LDAGLPGLARKERRIVWSSDLRNRRGAEPHGAPRPLDRYDSIAVPIRADDEIQSVLVFYGEDIPEQDEQLNRTLCSIAEQIGQAVARERMSETLQKTEEVLRQTRKMEAIGMLAGGIAHDFNNLLMVILGNCELLLDGLVAQAQYPELVGEIRAAGERAASLTRQLLTFSRKRAAEPEVLNVNQLLADVDRMLQRVVGETIRIETGLAADTYPVRMDRVELEQVLLNLAANARDAMPTGGKLTITTANAALGLKAVTPYPDVQPGEFVVLSVADTGCGMDEQTRSRAFEPFFTTKGVEKGTGLGLATVYGIIRRSRGIVQLDSAPGVGTRFTIYLPRCAIGITPRQIDERPADDPRGSETVLVVEDEDVLRRLVQRILEVHGYTVHAASNGPAALGFLRRSAGTVDLLLTDVVMPQMSGIQLVAEARRLRADLPVLFMSGYPDLADPSGNGIPRGPELLCKPFTSDALARAVRKALDSGSVRATPAAGQARLHS
jgi:signal transduction histidine kinase/ActR/RegA family two-component response regulator